MSQVIPCTLCSVSLRHGHPGHDVDVIKLKSNPLIILCKTVQEIFADMKGVNRRHKSKDRQSNGKYKKGQKDKQ